MLLLLYSLLLCDSLCIFVKFIMTGCIDFAQIFSKQVCLISRNEKYSLLHEEERKTNFTFSVFIRSVSRIVRKIRIRSGE